MRDTNFFANDLNSEEQGTDTDASESGGLAAQLDQSDVESSSKSDGFVPLQLSREQRMYLGIFKKLLNLF